MLQLFALMCLSSPVKSRLQSSVSFALYSFVVVLSLREVRFTMRRVTVPSKQQSFSSCFPCFFVSFMLVSGQVSEFFLSISFPTINRCIEESTTAAPFILHLPVSYSSPLSKLSPFTPSSSSLHSRLFPCPTRVTFVSPSHPTKRQFPRIRWDVSRLVRVEP